MHIEQSLYEILGVSPDADDETIKKAYRKMAQLYHPDKVGNTPESTERFAQICKAYEILSDPEKKALYDRPRRARTFYRSSWRPPKGANFADESSHMDAQFTQQTHRRNPAWKQPQNSMNLDDLFSDSEPSPSQFGGRYAQNQARAGERSDGEDIHVDVDVPMSTARVGGMVQFEYRRNRRTDGMDVQSVLELFYLRVPAGTRDGEVLDIEKMGHTGMYGGRSGDLHCTVHLVQDLDNASRSRTTHATVRSDATQGGGTGQRKDSAVDERGFAGMSASSAPEKVQEEGIVWISFPEAVLGGRVVVETPQGNVMITIPARSSSGRKLRIRGKGLNGSDYIVTLQISIPTDLDAESIRLVEAFAERNPISPRSI